MDDEHKLYIDIDSLLDTRLATLQKLTNLYFLDETIESYLTRNNDNFNYIGYTNFYRLYKRRTVDIVKSALPTSIYVLLANIIPANSITNLTLNLYPYPSTNRFNGLLSSIYGATITTMSVKPTAKLLGEFDTIVTYNATDMLDSWLATGDVVRGGVLSRSTIYTSATLKSDLKLTEKENATILENMGTLYKGCVTLNYLMPILFSIEGEHNDKT